MSRADTNRDQYMAAMEAFIERLRTADGNTALDLIEQLQSGPNIDLGKGHWISLDSSLARLKSPSAT